MKLLEDVFIIPHIKISHINLGFISARNLMTIVFGLLLANNKSVSIDSVTESNDTSYGYQALVAGLWSNSAAITNITLTPETGNYAQYSTATLYGIKNS